MREISEPVSQSVSLSNEAWDVAIKQDVGSQWVMGSEWAKGMEFVVGAVLWDVSAAGRRRSRRWASDCHHQLPRRRRFAKAGCKWAGCGTLERGVGRVATTSSVVPWWGGLKDVPIGQFLRCLWLWRESQGCPGARGVGWAMWEEWQWQGVLSAME